jgi:hypothetical protein
MAQLISQQFHAALSYLLKKEGRGAQSRLADQQKIDRGYLNGIVKGRKPGSEKVRGKIAAYFEMTYEDILALGRRLLSKKEGGGDEKSEAGTTAVKSKQFLRNEKDLSIPIDISSRKSDQVSSSVEELIISDKIKKAVEILESDSNYSKILGDLIDAFHEAVSMKKDNLALRNQMKEMESRIASLEEKLGKNKKDRRQSA